MIRTMSVLTLAAYALPAAGEDSDRRPPLGRPASTMTGSEIKAYNVGLAPTHPDFIKCRKIEEIGSLVKKARVCHTNDEWKRLWEQGNRDSRETVEHFGSKGSGCPPTAVC
ncbi:hypothetical protein GGC65_002159 [Sphingopyxis sp. OAS728]|uniref:hypothetical protein n=1 Tax=Sphingopyxis sp. OAS728 TaxID=2663823 RepID=UPI0019EE4491|nr:hypothetical protein [Sphingopyxis sp. OAS728]MBE1527703.1 hypothetical protein [Sphingopyxis sp. OAS728]